MLGRMIVRVLTADPSLTVTATTRPTDKWAALPRGIETWKLYDPEWGGLEPLTMGTHYDWIINAIGITKPHISEQSPLSVKRALEINSIFPHTLASFAEQANSRVIQIATDCVFSGNVGRVNHYHETTTHDAGDVYGLTKRLGEVKSPYVRHLRMSIIGPEMAGRESFYLLDKARYSTRPTMPGFTDHEWNGVTTLAFANITRAIIAHGPRFFLNLLPPVLHVVPNGRVTKAELLEQIVSVYELPLKIERTRSIGARDMVLSTQFPELVTQLWLDAGYVEPPSIGRLLMELREYGD